MIVSDNLYSSVHSFITPDFITQMGRFIGETSERTTRGAKSVFTTVLLGLVNNGTTPEGAKNLIEITKTQGSDPDDGVRFDELQVKRGTKTIREIFGQGIGVVIGRLQETTGLDPSTITRMLGVVTPLVVGILGTKVQQDAMSPTTLANFLRHQRQALLSNLPGQFYELKKVVVSNRKTAVTIGVLAVLMGFWIFAKIANRPMESDLSQKRPIPQRMEQMVSLTRLAPIAQLEEFLEEGEDSELPKRFYLSGMKFHSEASELLPGAEKELKLLAKVLLDNPYARTRLEGFTDNGGDPLRMQQLSDERAMAIKNQLVARGVDENQIETAGLGPADSVADNESAEGRAKNNRIEFIVLEK